MTQIRIRKPKPQSEPLYLVMEKHMTGKSKAYYSQIRIHKILDYAKRYSKRTVTSKEKDFEEIDEYHRAWVEHRMTGPEWTWTCWNGIEEVWEPWNRFGEPVNRWSEVKTKWASQ